MRPAATRAEGSTRSSGRCAWHARPRASRSRTGAGRSGCWRGCSAATVCRRRQATSPGPSTTRSPTSSRRSCRRSSAGRRDEQRAIPLADARNLRSYARVTAARHRGARGRRRRLRGRVRARLAEPAHADDLGAAAACQRRDRARPLGEHLLRHVLANRRRRCERCRAAAAGSVWSSSRATRTRRCRPARRRRTWRRSSRYFTLPRQRVPGYLPSFPPNPWTNTFTARHQYLDRHAARERDRLRATSAPDDRAGQRPRRRPWRHPGAHADPPERPSQEGAGTRRRPQSDAERLELFRSCARAPSADRRGADAERAAAAERNAVPVGAGRSGGSRGSRARRPNRWAPRLDWRAS